MSLPPRQLRFVEEYLADPKLNATQAYIRAGYEARGNAAEANASRLLRNAKVRAEIERRQAARSERKQLDADYVIDGLRAEAEYHGEGASHSARVAAFGLLMRHLGLLNDKLKVEHSAVEVHIYTPKKNAPPN